MPQQRSRIVQIRSPLAIKSDGNPDPDIVHQMLDAGLTAFFDSHEYPDLISGIFRDDDLIGMKVNTLGGPGMSTSPNLVRSLRGILQDCGIAGKNLLAWDRSDHELKKAGFELNGRGDSLCFGTDHTGIGYGKDFAVNGSVGSLLSRIQTDYCSGIINMPILKDHGIAGITCALKNHFGAIHNPNKYHDNGCDPYIADLNSVEQIGGKQRLIIVDCLRVQYHGGPSYQPAWTADFGGLLIGTDPVAIDTVAMKIIEDLRVKGGKPPLKGSKREPIYIRTALERGLGIGDIAAIDLVNMSI